MSWEDEMLLRRSELACRQMVELITDYLEDSLPRSQRRRFDAHIAGCEHCSEYLDQMRTTIRLTGRLRAEDMTPDMHREFAEIYRRWRSEPA